MPKKPLITEEERDLFQTQMDQHAVTRLHKSARQPLPLPGKLKPVTVMVEKPIIAHSPVQFGYPCVATVSSEEALQFRRPGLQERVMQKLRRGEYPIEVTLDLHGLTLSQADAALEELLLQAQNHHWRHMLIVHGKTARGDNAVPILKNRVNQWLRGNAAVLAFCSAKQSQGGVGAVYVLLRKA